MSDKGPNAAEQEETLEEDEDMVEEHLDEEQLAGNEDEMMNMFASVWVKVEVKEGEEEPRGEQPPCGTLDENETNKQKPRRTWKSGKQLKCNSCDYTTVYKHCLEIHVAGHGTTKPHACTQCGYTTKYASSLLRHTTIKHNDDNEKSRRKTETKVKCDHCDYSTNFKWNLYAHKRKHKLEKQFKCPQCPFETAYRHNLIKHGKVHRDDEVFKCDKCPFVTKFEGHIQRHLAKIHKEVTEIYQRYRCDLCEFSTKEKWRLNIHKQRSKQESPMKCLYCDFQTEYRCEKRKHKTCHYSELYGNGRSPSSPKILEDINTIMYGNKNEDPQKIYEDPQRKFDGNMLPNTANLSNENVSAAVNLEKQEPFLPVESKPDSNNKYTLDPDCVEWSTIQVLESDDKDRPFQCHMCDYTSKFKASVQRHFQRHHTGTQNRPFKCCNCDFSTKTKDQIALHNKRSQSEVLLYCTIPNCIFSTYFKCKFGMHQKDHYVFKCTICNFSFKHKYGLTKHIATLHLGNTLKCNYCDYKASRRESILCHETIHTGIKPFKCGFCDYSSVRKSLLDIHMKRYHSEHNKDITVVSNDKINELKFNLFGQKELTDALNSSEIRGELSSS